MIAIGEIVRNGVLKFVFQVLSEHLLPSDLAEIQGIVIDIESRIKRFSKQKKKLE